MPAGIGGKRVGSKEYNPSVGADGGRSYQYHFQLPFPCLSVMSPASCKNKYGVRYPERNNPGLETEKGGLTRHEQNTTLEEDRVRDY